MRQSKLFTKTLKDFPKDELSLNAQLLIKGGFVQKVSAGVYSFLPLGLRTYNKIAAIIRDEMNAIDGQEILMPALIPKELWDTTGRWEKIDVLFKLGGIDKKEYALGATHEEIVTPLLKKYISSYKELPVAVYQIQTKFRNELRAKAGLIRGREFAMKDLYSFHADEANLDIYYKKATEAYFKIYKRAGLGDLTYLTYASGGVFSKYSHEFQTITDAGEDLIYICEKCRVAINREIIKDQKGQCPECGSKDLKEKKAVEVGNIFKLGTKFSEPFDLSYMDENGDKKMVLMGCYGIGLGRLMGTVVELHNDERGIIWPEEIAPFKAHLIEVSSKASEVKNETEKLYKILKDNGVEVLYDDREAGAGQKFADADLIGCPYRIVISEKTLAQGVVEIKKRNESEAKLVKTSELVEMIR